VIEPSVHLVNGATSPATKTWLESAGAPKEDPVMTKRSLGVAEAFDTFDMAGSAVIVACEAVGEPAATTSAALTSSKNLRISISLESLSPER
jgi:hypothetical protein